MSEQLSEKRIGFIGAGAMARALAGGLLASGVESDRVRAADPSPEARNRFQQELGVTASDDNGELVGSSDIVVLAVKPGVVAPLLADLSGSRGTEKPLWISIAAGVSIAALSGALPGGARIVRAMPNTPALVRAGASALCANSQCTEADCAAAEALFQAVGITWRAPDEALLDAVTGLSGSGPAYVFLILEALGDAGVRAGLPREAAYRLAFQTVYGAAKLAIESGIHPAALKDQVTSPGGTTIAGLERLEAGGLRATLHDAVAAATARSRQLAGC